MAATTPNTFSMDTAARESPWVRGPVWDSVWMLNALWLVPVALWLSRGTSDVESGALVTMYFGLTALFWIGPRVSCPWLTYCTEAYRPRLREEPLRFIVIPLLVTLGCFLVILPAD